VSASCVKVDTAVNLDGMNKQSHQLLITGAAVVGAAGAAYRGAVRRTLRHGAPALMAGDPEPLLRTFAEDAVLPLDGTHSWAGEHRGKAGIRAFFERFLRARVRGEVPEILVQGPPWQTTVTARFTDYALSPAA
jgi:ketosteroid isomerase-like protein